MAKSKKLKVESTKFEATPVERKVRTRITKFTKTYDDNGNLFQEEWSEEIEYEDDLPGAIVDEANKWVEIGSTPEGSTFKFVPTLEDDHKDHVHVNAAKFYTAPLHTAIPTNVKISGVEHFDQYGVKQKH